MKKRSVFDHTGIIRNGQYWSLQFINTEILSLSSKEVNEHGTSISVKQFAMLLL